MAGFTNSEEVFGALTKTLGKFCKEVTGKSVVEADENIIPKLEGEFILIDLSDADQLDWQDNEWTDANGVYQATHNYSVTYTLTAYRGKPQVVLARVLQAMNLPFIYDKYFPDGSAFAYSSSSSISRMRVPLNQQFFENRARVQIIFNVSFLEHDNGEFEDLEHIAMSVGITDPSGKVIDIPITIDLPPAVTP